jgi:hypothetical protein
MSGITHCLDHALVIARDRVPADQVAARLAAVPEACAHPDRCGHAARGCRQVNRDYLADTYRVAAAVEAAKARAKTARTP